MNVVHLGDRRDHVRALGFTLGHSSRPLLYTAICEWSDGRPRPSSTRNQLHFELATAFRSPASRDTHTVPDVLFTIVEGEINVPQVREILLLVGPRLISDPLPAC